MEQETIHEYASEQNASIHNSSSPNDSLSGWFNKFVQKVTTYYRCDETTIFLMNIVIVYLLFSDTSMSEAFLKFLVSDRSSNNSGGIGALFVVGFTASSYLAIFRKHDRSLKYMTGVYVVVINWFVAEAAWNLYSLRGASFLTLIFPAINIALSFFIMIALKDEAINIDSIVDDRHQAKFRGLLIGSIAVIILLYINTNFFRTYWIETFSLCLFYITFIDQAVTKYFSGNGRMEVMKKI